jgi:hypothetical protein
MDCLEGMEFLEDGCVDVIVTSPPYNIVVSYSHHRDDMPREIYLDWIERVVLECRWVLKEGGSFLLNIGGMPSDQVLQFEVLEVGIVRHAHSRYILRSEKTPGGLVNPRLTSPGMLVIITYIPPIRGGAETRDGFLTSTPGLRNGLRHHWTSHLGAVTNIQVKN